MNIRIRNTSNSNILIIEALEQLVALLVDYLSLKGRGE